MNGPGVSMSQIAIRRLSQRCRETGYFYVPAASLTLGMGLYMHLCRAFLGDAITLARVFTPAYDRILTIPMIYSMCTGILSFRRAIFLNGRHRAVFVIVLFYITASVPLHIWKAYIQYSTKYLTWFPMAWTYLLIPAFCVWILVLNRTRYTPEGNLRRHGHRQLVA